MLLTESSILKPSAAFPVAQEPETCGLAHRIPPGHALPPAFEPTGHAARPGLPFCMHLFKPCLPALSVPSVSSVYSPVGPWVVIQMRTLSRESAGSPLLPAPWEGVLLLALLAHCISAYL